jgi:hypothetical protein
MMMAAAVATNCSCGCTAAVATVFEWKFEMPDEMDVASTSNSRVELCGVSNCCFLGRLIDGDQPALAAVCCVYKNADSQRMRSIVVCALF